MTALELTSDEEAAAIQFADWMKRASGRFSVAWENRSHLNVFLEPVHVVAFSFTDQKTPFWVGVYLIPLSLMMDDKFPAEVHMLGEMMKMHDKFLERQAT